MNHGKKLLNCLRIILELCLKLNIKQNTDRVSNILTPQQMLQRLPVALPQVKAGNTSENLLNEIRQIINSLYRAKEITRKVCNNIMDSIKL